MRNSNTHRDRNRTPEAQQAVEEGPFYKMLMAQFVGSFSPDKREIAGQVFRRKEAENSGWSPKIEESARAMVEAVSSAITTSAISRTINDQVKPVVQQGAPVAGNEAESVSDLGGNYGQYSDFNELRLSARVEDPETIKNGETPPPAPDSSEGPQDMSLEAMIKRLHATVGEQEAGRIITTAIENVANESADIQTAYARGARGNG